MAKPSDMSIAHDQRSSAAGACAGAPGNVPIAVRGGGQLVESTLGVDGMSATFRGQDAARRIPMS
jgi:hypothetical protein